MIKMTELRHPRSDSPKLKLNQKKIDLIANKKQSKANKNLNQEIEYVLNNTMRTIKNLRARTGEFVYRTGRRVPKGRPYHVHYTTNFDEYFMTGRVHSKGSKFITKINRPTDYSLYRQLVGETKLYVGSGISTPTAEEYEKGYMKRYFASKVNESTGPFEVLKKDYDSTSPLYYYTSLVWFIKGQKQFVLEANILSVARAEEIMQGVRRLLPDFQYFVSKEIIDRKTVIENKLGIGNLKLLQKSAKTTTTAPPSGPPPGVTTGGAGGAY
jgi:hypothetical protein